MRRLVQIGCWLLLVLTLQSALAHESLPLFLGIEETAPGTFDVTWRIPATQGVPPAISPSFPEQCATAAAPTLSPGLGTMVGHAILNCGPSGLNKGSIVLAGLERTTLDAVVRIGFMHGKELTEVLHPKTPVMAMTGRVRGADAGGYFGLGVEHILFGADHLLFVFGLLLIVRNGLMLLKTITAFTLAHSLTLAAATLGYVSLPLLPVEAAIALSILFLGPEIVRARAGGTSLTIRHPWIVAFAFGLLHGFGFAGGLTEIGLPHGDIPLALLLFNLGVEAGQVAFVILALGAGRLLKRAGFRWSPGAKLIPAYGVGALGAFWTFQRLAMLFGA